MTNHGVKKILVTGGAGFIGSHLCERLLKEGFEVVAFDNLLLGREEFLEDCKRSPKFRFVKADLLDFERVKSEMKGVDLVFHLAANSDISQPSTDIDLKIGTIATYNVLEAMRQTEVRKIIFSSTSAIYGEADIKPTPENYGPLLPISFYGASKLACEALCTAFAHNYDFQVWIYRFANIVGSHTTHGAIHDFIKRLKSDPSQLRVLGDGSQRKSYLHVLDCVDGMLHGFRKSDEHVQFFNLASEGVTRVKFIAEEIVQQLGVPAKINYTGGDRGWKGDVPYTHLDGSKFAKLGWKASCDSDEAVRRAIHDVIEEWG